MAKEKIGYCQIDSLILSSKSRRAVEEVRDIMAHGDLFSIAVASVPVYQIFFGTPSIRNAAFESGLSIREYDWEEWGKAMVGTNAIVKKKVADTAFEAVLSTNGKEQAFWKCVYESAL